MNDYQTTQRARELREKQTKAESLLWQLIRAQQLCGLKFRRQHPDGPYFADFACVSKKTIVEVDGGYHEQCEQQDRERQKHFEDRGWKVIRFPNEELLHDVESVGISIARQMGLPYEYKKRNATGAGMLNVNSPNEKRKRNPK